MAVAARDATFQYLIKNTFGNTSTDKMSALPTSVRPTTTQSKLTSSDVTNETKINKARFAGAPTDGTIIKGLLGLLSYESVRRGLEPVKYTQAQYDAYFTGDGPDGNKKKIVAADWDSYFDEGVEALTPKNLSLDWNDAHGYSTHYAYFADGGGKNSNTDTATGFAKIVKFPVASAPSAGVPITNQTKITAAFFNSIIKKFEDIGEVCVCNCNYCTCNCNYCTCNCNYACTCNCNY